MKNKQLWLSSCCKAPVKIKLTESLEEIVFCLLCGRKCEIKIKKRKNVSNKQN
jgi:hypothetical protein